MPCSSRSTSVKRSGGDVEGMWRTMLRISVIVDAHFRLIVDGETASFRARREARKHWGGM